MAATTANNENKEDARFRAPAALQIHLLGSLSLLPRFKCDSCKIPTGRLAAAVRRVLFKRSAFGPDLVAAGPAGPQSTAMGAQDMEGLVKRYGIALGARQSRTATPVIAESQLTAPVSQTAVRVP